MDGLPSTDPPREDDSLSRGRRDAAMSRWACTPEYGRCLLSVGLRQARRIGVAQQDMEDCALDFVAHFLGGLPRCSARLHDQLQDSQSVLFHAWTIRCAANHARNFQRSQRRRTARCLCCSELADLTGVISGTRDAADEDSVLSGCELSAHKKIHYEAEKPLLLTTFWEEASTLLLQLTPRQYNVFYSCIIEDLPIRVVADRMSSNPDTVRHLLERAKRRLRHFAVREQWEPFIPPACLDD
jgi:RNA polymerase sigma factor (sigma-70 family)